MLPSNKLVITGYVLGIITILLAIYLIIHPYTVHVYYNGTLSGTLSITTNVNDYLMLRLSTNGESSRFNVTIIERIPQTNIMVPQYYVINLSQGVPKIVNFTSVKELIISGNGSIVLMGIRRPLINYILTLVLIIVFIFALALLVIGYLKSIENLLGKT